MTYVNLNTYRPAPVKPQHKPSLPACIRQLPVCLNHQQALMLLRELRSNRHYPVWLVSALTQLASNRLRQNA